jgi:hypothetical protein
MKIATNELLKELKLSTFVSSFEALEKKADRGNWRLLKQSKRPPQYTFETLDQKLLTTKVRKPSIHF